MSADHAYAKAPPIEQAPGATEAVQLADAIAEGRMAPEHAWPAFVELQVRHGRHNLPVLRTFVTELARRAVGP